MWLECISVVSGCCFKKVHVYRFSLNISYPYSTCISSIFVAASLLLCSFKKCFFVLWYSVQCSAVYSAVQCSAVQYSAMQYSAVQ